MMGADTGGDALKSQGMPSAAETSSDARKGEEKISPESLSGHHLLAPSFWTSGLQDCKRKKFLLFPATQVIIILFGIPPESS